MKLIVDTREQKPLWKHKDVTRRKLHEGDYSHEEIEHLITIERKSPGDLYGTILGGHERFRKELLRSIAKHKDFYLFVECSRDDFIAMKWRGWYHNPGGNPKMLAAIVGTLEAEYDVIFVWCKSRAEMRRKILELIEEEIERIKYCNT